MVRLRAGYYRAQVVHDHGLSRWSLTCDIVRVSEGTHRGWWSLTISHGATILLDGSDLKITKRDAMAAMNDALRRGWVHHGGLGWCLASERT